MSMPASRLVIHVIRALVFCVVLPAIVWYLSQPSGLYFLVYVYDPIFGPPKGPFGLIIWAGMPWLITGATFVCGLIYVRRHIQRP